MLFDVMMMMSTRTVHPVSTQLIYRQTNVTISSYRATYIDTPGWLHSAYVGLPSQMCGDDDAAAR